MRGGGVLFGLILIGLIGYQIKQQGGYPNRFYYSNQHTDGFGTEPWQAKGWLVQKTCLEQYGEYSFCLQQQDNKLITAMLIGDSQANHLYPGLIQDISLTGGNLLNLSVSKCLPFFDQDCLLIGKALELAIATPSVKTVILASYWEGLLTNKLNNANSQIEVSMKKTLQRLTEAKKRIIFVMNIPTLNFRPASCIKRPWRITENRVKTPCAIPRATHEMNTQKYSEFVKRVLTQFPNVTVWNPTDAFCDNHYCWAAKEGLMLYRDVNHLNQAGSFYLGNYFKRYYRL